MAHLKSVIEENLVRGVLTNLWTGFGRMEKAGVIKEKIKTKTSRLEFFCKEGD